MSFFEKVASFFRPNGEKVPIALNGIYIGYLDSVGENHVKDCNGKPAKLVWIPGRILNIVVEK